MAVSTAAAVGSTEAEADSTVVAEAFTAEEAQAFAVAEVLEALAEAEALVALAADEVSAALITEASEAFVVAEALVVFAATASLVALAVTPSSLTLISDSASGLTGVRTPIGTDMARGGGLTLITLPTTTLTILTTLRVIAIAGMIGIVVIGTIGIGTIGADRTIAIPTTGATTVPQTPLNQAAKILPQGLRTHLSRRSLLTGIM